MLRSREGGTLVKTSSEYRRYAEECRALAKQMTDIMQRDLLLMMAETWEQLAEDRKGKGFIHLDESSKEPPEH